jgi:hypothetical protein
MSRILRNKALTRLRMLPVFSNDVYWTSQNPRYCAESGGNWAVREQLNPGTLFFLNPAPQGHWLAGLPDHPNKQDWRGGQSRDSRFTMVRVTQGVSDREQGSLLSKFKELEVEALQGTNRVTSFPGSTVKKLPSEELSSGTQKPVLHWNVLVSPFTALLALPAFPLPPKFTGPWSMHSCLVLSSCSQQVVLAAGRDFWERPPAFSYCQLVGWHSVVSWCNSTQEAQLTRLSARLSTQTLQQSLYRADGNIVPGPGSAKPAVLFPFKGVCFHWEWMSWQIQSMFLFQTYFLLWRNVKDTFDLRSKLKPSSSKLSYISSSCSTLNPQLPNCIFNLHNSSLKRHLSTNCLPLWTGILGIILFCIPQMKVDMYVLTVDQIIHSFIHSTNS